MSRRRAKRLAREVAWLAYCTGYLFGPTWMAVARRSQRPVRRVALHDIGDVSACFEPSLLGKVSLLITDRVRLPGARIGAMLGLRIFRPAGICLGRVVCVDEEVAASEHFNAVVFHELVHCAQVEHLGVRAFCGMYLRGWIESGRSYHGIPLEEDAYRLQHDFEMGARQLVVVGTKKGRP